MSVFVSLGSRVNSMNVGGCVGDTYDGGYTHGPDFVCVVGLPEIFPWSNSLR